MQQSPYYQTESAQTEISGLLGSELNMTGHHIGPKHSLGRMGIHYGSDLQRLQQGFVLSEQHNEIAAYIHFSNRALWDSKWYYETGWAGSSGKHANISAYLLWHSSKPDSFHMLLIILARFKLEFWPYLINCTFWDSLENVWFHVFHLSWTSFIGTSTHLNILLHLVSDSALYLLTSYLYTVPSFFFFFSSVLFGDSTMSHTSSPLFSMWKKENNIPPVIYLPWIYSLQLWMCCTKSCMTGLDAGYLVSLLLVGGFTRTGWACVLSAAHNRWGIWRLCLFLLFPLHFAAFTALKLNLCLSPSCKMHHSYR